MIWLNGFEFMYILVFLIIVVSIISQIIRGVGQWNKNNQSPRLTVDATIITKRINVTYNNNVNEFGYTSTSTYYVTFEVQSGDRIEFCVCGKLFNKVLYYERVENEIVVTKEEAIEDSVSKLENSL